MQLVINISKDDFEEICMQAKMVEDTGSLFGRIRKAISHGVQLPKGHRKIIDSKEVYKFARKKFPHMNYDDCLCRRAIATALRYTTAIIDDDEVEE